MGTTRHAGGIPLSPTSQNVSPSSMLVRGGSITRPRIRRLWTMPKAMLISLKDAEHAIIMYIAYRAYHGILPKSRNVLLHIIMCLMCMYYYILLYYYSFNISPLQCLLKKNPTHSQPVYVNKAETSSSY